MAKLDTWPPDSRPGSPFQKGVAVCPSVVSPSPIDKQGLIEFAQKLVRCQSWNPPGDESAVAALVAEQLKAFGLDVSLSPVAPQRHNVYGRLRGGGNGKEHLLLVSHLDTVPPGSKPWQKDPLSGDVDESRLYGRGSADMKGGLAAIVFAAGALVDMADQLGGDIVIAGTVGEEVDCLGAHKLVEDGLLESVGAIAIPEPSGLELYTAHKGALWVKVAVNGRSAHGSRPDLGANAILYMNETIRRIMEFDWSAEPHTLLGTPTINIGTIRGGHSTNVVPDYAEMTVDFRTLPSQSHTGILNTLKKILGEIAQDIPEYKAGLETINDKPAMSTLLNDPFVMAAQSVGKVMWNTELVPKGVTYYTDASVLAPACQKPVIILGPGHAEQAHQTDEYIEIDYLFRAAEFYSQLASSWLR